MKLSLLFAACTLACSTTQVVTHTSRAADAADLADKTVALVRSDIDGNGQRAYCSGTWVGPRLILTADHCTHDAEIGEMFSYVLRSDVPADGSNPIFSRKALLYARDADHDLALLHATVENPRHAVTTVSIVTVKQGDPVQTMGHSLGLWWSYSTGVVSAIRYGEYSANGRPAAWWIQTTAPTSPGNSGGGLFDEDGFLVGVCHGGFVRGQNLNLYVHTQYVDAFLRAYR